VSLAPNQATELGTLALPEGQPLVLAARLRVQGQIAARAALWPEPFKYLDLPEPGIELSHSGDQLVLRAARPAKGVWLEAGDGVAWSDNFIDLLPADEVSVTAAGLNGATPTMRWLGNK
jgi:beta-mannosidase